ncbi:hypothetical protein CEXT_399071 [Caerostris extrusa]|uniref:Uncharacterized protein n=1 Tax=Caerostris extrusa TaxID=172846 RepID=A0AAV4XF83_CAEEX|nr:hypothetical protein CEXT_399071 [Caerostris extrusa]
MLSFKKTTTSIAVTRTPYGLPSLCRGLNHLLKMVKTLRSILKAWREVRIIAGLSVFNIPPKLSGDSVTGQSATAEAPTSEKEADTCLKRRTPLITRTDHRPSPQRESPKRSVNSIESGRSADPFVRRGDCGQRVVSHYDQ